MKSRVDVICGFLGAGKTTLIKKLLQDGYQGKKVVLIENEFGEVGVDEGFLQDSKATIRELNSGCICCSLEGDFEEALHQVKETYEPEIILIEPSGVGKLSNILAGIQNSDDYDVQQLICVVDTKKVKMYRRNFKEFFEDQIKYAKKVMLSKTQNLSEEKINEAIHIIREINPNAVLVSEAWEKLKGEDILKAVQVDEELQELLEQCKHHHHDEEECGCGHHHHHDEEECGCGHHHHHDEEECGCGHHHHHDEEECGCGHHHHDEEECGCGHHHHHDEEECGCGHHHHHDEEECGCGHHHHHHDDMPFESVGFDMDGSYDMARLKSALNQLSDNILRAKGYLKTDEGWVEFDFVSGDIQIRSCSAKPMGRVCVIGIDLDKEWIQDVFGVSL